MDTDRNERPCGCGRQCRFVSLHSLHSGRENDNPCPESVLTETRTGKVEQNSFHAAVKEEGHTQGAVIFEVGNGQY